MNYCYFVTFVFCTYIVNTSLIVSACIMHHASSVEKNWNLAVNVTGEALKDAGEKISEGTNKAKDFVEKAFDISKEQAEIAGHVMAKAVENEFKRSFMRVNNSIGCCAHIEEEKIDLNSTICVNITYLSHDYGILFTITANGDVVICETVSVRSPPPFCLNLPYVKKLADVCVRLYDIDVTATSLHVCMRIGIRMKKYELGCFDIGSPRATPVTEYGSMCNGESMSNGGSMSNGFIVLAIILLVVMIWILKKAKSRVSSRKYRY